MPLAGLSLERERNESIARSLWRRRELLWEMAKRDIRDRYAGHSLGVLWAIALPLVQMAVYFFLFGLVFRARLGVNGGPDDYAAFMLSGLVPWLALQETMARGTAVLPAQVSLVKQVVFPLEILPAKTVVAALLLQAVPLSVLAAYAAWRGQLGWSWALLGPLLVMQGAALLGVAFLFAALGAFLRDLKEIVSLAAFLGAYVTPIFYLPEWVPEPLRPLMTINPASSMVWAFQDALYHGEITRPFAWIVLGVGSVVVLLVGLGAFARLRPAFADVL